MKKSSRYQQDIFNAVITTNSNIAVVATAGSGKTTTIVEASKMIQYGKSAIFVAFNKSIVKELKEKLPSTVDCMTMHSLGMKCIYNHYPGDKKIKEDKQLQFIIPFYEKINSQREKWAKTYQVDRVMKLARATMTQPNFEALDLLCNTYAIDIEEEDIEIAAKALRKLYSYNDDTERYSITIDFQDMIEKCVRNKEIRMPQYDYVFIDEAQDLSKLDQLFINRLVKKLTGRKIVVGDPRQSIYHFRGSDPKSFEAFTNEPNTIQLPLSISYRCAQNIVREAQEVYNDIEPFEQNEEGVVRTGKVSEIQEGDMVLCRNTRPLISVYLDLLRAEKKASIIGKETEKGLLALLSGFEGSDTTSECYNKLDEILDRVGGGLTAKGIVNPTNHPKYVRVLEQVEILKIIFSLKNSIFEVEKFIESVFDESRDGVRLMTIHKSKGLENDRVFVIEVFEGKQLIPSPYAVTPDQLIQERNLRFVAYTRARKELVKLIL